MVADGFIREAAGRQALDVTRQGATDHVRELGPRAWRFHRSIELLPTDILTNAPPNDLQSQRMKYETALTRNPTPMMIGPIL